MWAARRGQLSLEFFIALLLLFLFFSIALDIYTDEEQNANSAVSAMGAQSVASDFARAINGVYQCGNGCSYTLQLKQGYSIAIYGRTLEVLGGSGISDAPLVTDTVNISSADTGNVTVVNNNGTVSLHDA